MKKTLLIILILCAIPLYSYNIILLIRSILPHATETSAKTDISQSFDQLMARSQIVQFTPHGKSPFAAFKENPVESPKKEQANQSTPKNVAMKKEISKPAIIITGIMWSTTNPVAMVTLPDGSSAVVKSGGIYGDFTVKKIEKNRIQIVYEKTTFWIDK